MTSAQIKGLIDFEMTQLKSYQNTEKELLAKLIQMIDKVESYENERAVNNG